MLIRLIILNCFFISSIYCQELLPSDLPQLALWLRADSVTTINKKVQTWHEYLGNDAIQTNTSLQPIFIDSVLNNHPVIYFSGSYERLIGSSEIIGLNNSSFTIFIVSAGNFITQQTIECIFNINDYTNGFWLSRRSFNSEQFLTSYNNGLNSITSNVNSLPNNGYKHNIIAYKKSLNLQSSLFINGNQQATSNNSSLNSAFTNTNYSIGQSGFGFTSITGNIAEIIIFKDHLNDSLQKIIENYLNKKYAPPIKLPSDISISNSICDTIIKIVNPHNNLYSNFLWNTGATTPTISINQSGKYWLKATNIFGKESGDTIVVSFPQINEINNSKLCSGNSIKWNTNLPKSDFTFQWQDNSNDSLFIITAPGNYYTTITDNFSCSYTTNTITVTQDNFPTTTTLGADASICAGNSIALQTNTNSAITYTWNDGSHQQSLMVNNSGQYFLAVTNTNNCLAKDTIQITVVGQAPSVNFDFSVGCKNSLVTFTNMSVAPSGNNITSSFWNFGNASSSTNTSSVSNPSHIYTDTGSYMVYLNVITDAGCNNSISKSIHIAPTPTVNFVYSTPCQNDSVQFSSIISSPNYPVISRSWNFGDASSGINNSSTLSSPKHVFNINLSYTVKHIAINNAGCKDSISKSVIVKSQVKADFTYSLACTNELVKFKDNSIVPNPNSSNVRNWNFGGATATGTLINYFYPIAGVYSVSLSVIGNNGCNSNAIKQITVTASPISNFTVPSGFCKSDSILLTDGSSGTSPITNWTWTSDNTFSSSLPSFYYKNSISGNHNIQLKVINSSGCKDSIAKIITVNNLPAVSFTTFPNDVFSGTTATLTPITNSNTASTYTWSDGVGFYSNLNTPIYAFSDTGTYHILLQIKDVNGCKNTKQSTIYVLNKRIDLAILDISTIIKDDGYLDITAHLANFGNSTINQFKIKTTVLNSSTIKEQWTGNLNKSSLLDFHFQSEILANDPLKNNVICLEITEVNSSVDDNITNNSFCKDLSGKGNFVCEPYPSPTNGDITFPISLKQNEKVGIEIINMLGEVVFTTNVDANEGFNSIPVSLKNMSSGYYISKITIDGNTTLKKITKE